MSEIKELSSQRAGGDDLLQSAKSTTAAVAMLLSLPFMMSFDFRTALSFPAGALACLGMVQANEWALAHPRARKWYQGRVRLLIALSLKLVMLGGYLTFMLGSCSLPPVHFLVGFTLFYLVLTAKAVHQVNRDGLALRSAPRAGVEAGAPTFQNNPSKLTRVRS